MANLTQGYTDEQATRKRVYYEGTNTVYEGMPVFYNYDTTDNWLNYSTSEGGDWECQSAPGTTAEGYQNEGKFIRVEDPSAGNLQYFAGVVAHGKGVGEDGPCEVDVFVSNGAIVPVYTDVNCTVGRTVLFAKASTQELTGDGRPVAIAMETVDRSSTSGLVLAKLCPDEFLFQTGANAALLLDDESATDTIIMNQIVLSESQTAGSFVPLYIHHTSDGNASAALHEYNILSYLDLSGTYDQAGYNRNILSQLNLSGTLNSGGAHFYSMYAQLTGTPTATEVGHIAAVGIDCNLGVNPTTGNYTGILIANNGANQTEVDSAITIYGNYGINYLFDWESCDGLTANFISDGGTGASKVIDTGSGDWYKVKVNYGGTDAYLIIMTDPTEAAN